MNEYELYHHGILGMKWGVRRYQNKDGSLTAAGQKRYGVVDQEQNKRANDRLRGYSLDGLHKKTPQLSEKKARRAEAKKLKEEAKKEKEEKKRVRIEISNKHGDYEAEYDKTDKGKADLKAYQKQIKRMENSSDWGTDKDIADFSKVEEKYLKGQAAYAANKLMKDYGSEKISVYLRSGRQLSDKEATEALIAMWKTHTY